MTVSEANIPMSFEKSVYRLIGMDGRPHPILDTQYESMDAAINAVNNWNSKAEIGCIDANSSIGIEVMTSNGCWRTILY